MRSEHRLELKDLQFSQYFVKETNDKIFNSFS